MALGTQFNQQVTSGGTIVVNISPPTALFSGQQAVTASAVNLGSQVLRAGVALVNEGPATIWYGPTGITTSTGTPLLNGEAASIPIGNLSAVYVIAVSTGSSVGWSAS